MAGINVTLKGFGELQAKLDQAIKTLPAEIEAELEVAGQEVRDLAITAAPADQGILREGIQSVKTGSLAVSVFSNALYSGYVEFGTKSNVQIPAGLEDVAIQLKGASVSSLSAKEAIFNWCKRKGIDKRLWYPIYIKIMVKGIKAHPFFFRQLDVVRPNLLNNIKNILNSI
jgi:hypothetical protein